MYRWVDRSTDNGGKVLTYTLADENGNRSVVSSTDLRQAIASGRMEVENLRVTKDGKLRPVSGETAVKKSTNTGGRSDYKRQIEQLTKERDMYKAEVQKLQRQLQAYANVAQSAMSRTDARSLNGKVRAAISYIPSYDECMTVMSGFREGSDGEHVYKIYMSRGGRLFLHLGLISIYNPKEEIKGDGYFSVRLDRLFVLGYNAKVDENGVLNLGRGEFITDGISIFNPKHKGDVALEGASYIGSVCAPAKISRIEFDTIMPVGKAQHTTLILK